MQLQLAKWGNSLAVRLPRNILDAAKLKEGDMLEMQVREDGTLLIKPAIPKYSLNELIAGMTEDNRQPETDWGPPRGNEAW